MTELPCSKPSKDSPFFHWRKAKAFNMVYKVLSSAPCLHPIIPLIGWILYLKFQPVPSQQSYSFFLSSYDFLTNNESESCSVLSDFFDSMDYIVHGILQARILEWVAFSFSRGSSQSRDRTQVSRTAGGFFTSWATREAQGNPSKQYRLLMFIGCYLYPPDRM